MEPLKCCATDDSGSGSVVLLILFLSNLSIRLNRICVTVKTTAVVVTLLSRQYHLFLRHQCPAHSVNQFSVDFFFF